MPQYDWMNDDCSGMNRGSLMKAIKALREKVRKLERDAGALERVETLEKKLKAKNARIEELKADVEGLRAASKPPLSPPIGPEEIIEIDEAGNVTAVEKPSAAPPANKGPWPGSVPQDSPGPGRVATPAKKPSETPTKKKKS